MAAHAPWGAGNDPPQAMPGWKYFLGFLHFLLPASIVFFIQEKKSVSSISSLYPILHDALVLKSSIVQRNKNTWFVD